MKISLLFRSFVILFSFYSELKLFSQSLLIDYSNPDRLSICNSDTVFLNLRNTGDKDLHNPDIDAFLPNGIEYVLGSISNASEKNVSQLNKPQFSINTLKPGSSIQLRFLIHADCNTNDTIRFENKILVKSGVFMDSITSSPYNIYKGLLIIFPVPNVTIELGSTGTRQISIKNTRLGAIQKFVFEDQHIQPAIITCTNRTILNETKQLLQLELSAKDFVNIGDRDSLFEMDEVIIIEELIQSNECKPNSVDSKFFVNWGCNGFVCQDNTVRASSLAVFEQTGKMANLNFNANAKAPKCICQDEASQQELIIANKGLRNAENIVIEIEAKKSVTAGALNYGFVKDSIDIIGNVIVDSIVYGKDSTCASRHLFYSIKIYVKKLNINDEFRIVFDWASCESMPPNGILEIPWFYSYEYNSECLDNSKRMLEEVEVKNRFIIKDSVFAMSSLRDQNNVLQADSIYKIYTTVDYPKNLKTEMLIVYLEIPSPLELMDSSFFLGMKAPSKIEIFRHIIGGTFIILTYEPPFKLSDTIIVTCVKVNCNSAFVDPNLIASNIKFKTSCSLPKLIIAKYLAEICTAAQLTCPENLGNCGPKQIIAHKTRIEFDCLKEVKDSFKVKGYMDLDSRVIRENYGLEDRNNDRFADSNTKADTSLIRLDRIMTGDTILSEIDGKIIVDIPGSSFDSLSVLITNNFFYAPYDIHLDWYDKSLNKIYQFKIPKLDTFKSRGANLSCSIATLTGLDLGDGWVLKLTPEMLHLLNQEFPNNTRFGEGDSMHLKFSSSVSSAVGFRIYNATIKHRIILRDRRDLNDRDFYCNEKNHLLQLVTDCVRFISVSTSDTICGNNFELPVQRIQIFPHLKNFFPFEFRSFLRLESLPIVTVTNGLRVDSVELRISYNDSSSAVLIRRMLLKAIPNGIIWSLLSDSLNLLQYDEAYQLDIKIFGSVSNCKELPSNGIYRLDLVSKIRSDALYPFHFDPDFNTTLLTRDIAVTFRIVQNNENDSLGLFNRSIVTSSRLINIDGNIKDLSRSGSFKFRLSSKKGLISNFNITVSPNASVQKISNNEFIVGGLQEGGTYKILFSGDNMACDGDTLLIESIWVCESAKIDSTNDCVLKKFEIPIIPRFVKLELDHFPKESKELLLCDTLPEIELYLYNADLGTAYDLFQDIFIPEGVTIIPGSTFLAYPSNSAFAAIPLPQKIGNNHYRFDISNLVARIKADGLPGIDTISKSNGLRIRFKLVTSCNSTINGYLSYLAQGKDICQQDIFSPNRVGNQIKIKGINTGATYDLSAKLTSKSICDSIATIFVSVKGSGVVQGGDSIRIFLPVPMDFVQGSFRVIQNIDNQVPVISNTNGGKYLNVLLRAGFSLDNDILFEIGVTNLSGIPCGIIKIPLEIFNRQRTLCVTTQQDCDVRVSKDQFEIAFEKKSIEIKIDSFKITENTGSGNYTHAIYLNNSNISFKTDSSICFNLFEDSNLNGILDANDKLIKEVCFPSSRFNKDGSLVLTDLLDEKLILNCNFILATSVKNCMCGQDTAYLQLNQLSKKRIVDPMQYCSNTSLTIGVDSNIIAKYKWIKGVITCDTCSKNKIVIPDTLTGVREFTYELIETLSGSCNRVYEFVIKAVPEVMGKKTITEVCFWDSVSISSGVRKNFRWTGPDIKNRDAMTQVIQGDSAKVYYLDFIDQANCPGIDTFCIVIKKYLGIINIVANSDTILLGDSVRISVIGGIKWQWINSADLDCDTCQSVIAKPKRSTLYTVEVTDSLGCKYVLQIPIINLISPCDSSNIFIPNAFSPNGDSKNDIFRVRSNNITSIYLIVYNRWGEKVFESYDINVGWDGTYKGDKLPPDVFGYYLEADCPGDKRFVKKGNVSLLK